MNVWSGNCIVRCWLFCVIVVCSGEKKKKKKTYNRNWILLITCFTHIYYTVYLPNNQHITMHITLPYTYIHTVYCLCPTARTARTARTWNIFICCLKGTHSPCIVVPYITQCGKSVRKRRYVSIYAKQCMCIMHSPVQQSAVRLFASKNK